MFTSNFVKQVIGEETILLNLQTSQCHCLDPHATVVYEQLEKSRSDGEILSILSEHFALTQEQAQACLTTAKGVLQEIGAISSEQAHPGRRDALKWLGGSMVLSTLLPTPAAASSCSLNILSAVYGATDGTDTFPPGFPAGTTKSFCSSSAGADPTSPQFFDRTSVVRSFVSSCSISGQAAENTNLGGDPLTGIFKELRITYRCNGSSVDQHLRVCENTAINITC